MKKWTVAVLLTLCATAFAQAEDTCCAAAKPEGQTKEQYMAATTKKMKAKGKTVKKAQLERWFANRDANKDGILTEAEDKAANAAAKKKK